MAKTFNFSANAINFGNFTADSQAAAQNLFADASGYKSWIEMCKQADEFGGNSVEIREVLENGYLSSEIASV
jgi:hypothetical protein